MVSVVVQAGLPLDESLSGRFGAAATCERHQTRQTHQLSNAPSHLLHLPGLWDQALPQRSVRLPSLLGGVESRPTATS